MNKHRIVLVLIIVLAALGITYSIIEGNKSPRVLPEPPEVNYDLTTIQTANVMITSTNVTIDGTTVKHGTGVLFYEEIFGEDTYYTVVTNLHVVNHTTGVNLIKVTDVNNQIYEAYIVEGSPNQTIDLVLLRFKKINDLVTVELASSLSVSELVVAIGFNAQEYQITYGTVEQITTSTIIHNAQSYPGFSGGALYNADLKVVGINVQIVTEPGTNNWIRSISIPYTVLNTYLEAIQNG